MEMFESKQENVGMRDTSELQESQSPSRLTPPVHSELPNMVLRLYSVNGRGVTDEVRDHAPWTYKTLCFSKNTSVRKKSTELWDIALNAGCWCMVQAALFLLSAGVKILGVAYAIFADI
ncbi:uncharacterized protein EDB93DRAFT_1338715 [Suillus bovinus]|uniref:uncharacterized protein n=1 Tax=Suillus bovinus TaxID=48563 RepID=UPI001B863970|nr:uncharacterized protein EDB93DRAFT_1338715 [Suillus bovinus]KAG2140937.1 hypothetical protein EDB93DRAFT_1338715 [Suillus bovinus]